MPVTPQNAAVAFNRAIALDGPARMAMLAVFSDQHPKLMRRLEELLAADRENDDKLHQPIAFAARTMSEQSADLLEGRQLALGEVLRLPMLCIRQWQ